MRKRLFVLMLAAFVAVGFYQSMEVQAFTLCELYCGTIFPTSPQLYEDCVNLCNANNCNAGCAAFQATPQLFFDCMNCCVFDYGCP